MLFSVKMVILPMATYKILLRHSELSKIKQYLLLILPFSDWLEILPLYITAMNM